MPPIPRLGPTTASKVETMGVTTLKVVVDDGDRVKIHFTSRGSGAIGWQKHVDRFGMLALGKARARDAEHGTPEVLRCSVVAICA